MLFARTKSSTFFTSPSLCSTPHYHQLSLSLLKYSLSFLNSGFLMGNILSEKEIIMIVISCTFGHFWCVCLLTELFELTGHWLVIFSFFITRLVVFSKLIGDKEHYSVWVIQGQLQNNCLYRIINIPSFTCSYLGNCISSIWVISVYKLAVIQLTNYHYFFPGK